MLVSAAGRFLWLAVTAPTEGEQADRMQELRGQRFSSLLPESLLTYSLPFVCNPNQLVPANLPLPCLLLPRLLAGSHQTLGWKLNFPLALIYASLCPWYRLPNFSFTLNRSCASLMLQDRTGQQHTQDRFRKGIMLFLLLHFVRLKE